MFGQKMVTKWRAFHPAGELATAHRTPKCYCPSGPLRLQCWASPGSAPSPRHPGCPCRKPATWELQVPVCLGFFRFRRSVRNSRHPQPLGTVRRGSRQPPAPHFPVRKPRVVYRGFCFDGATQPAHSRQHRQAAPAGQTLSRPTAPLAVGRILWVICGHITYKQVGLDGSGGITIRRPFSWVR